MPTLTYCYIVWTCLKALLTCSFHYTVHNHFVSIRPCPHRRHVQSVRAALLNCCGSHKHVYLQASLLLQTATVSPLVFQIDAVKCWLDIDRTFHRFLFDLFQLGMWHRKIGKTPNLWIRCRLLLNVICVSKLKVRCSATHSLLMPSVWTRHNTTQLKHSQIMHFSVTLQIHIWRTFHKKYSILNWSKIMVIIITLRWPLHQENNSFVCLDSSLHAMSAHTLHPCVYCLAAFNPADFLPLAIPINNYNPENGFTRWYNYSSLPTLLLIPHCYTAQFLRVLARVFHTIAAIVMGSIWKRLYVA